MDISIAKISAEVARIQKEDPKGLAEVAKDKWVRIMCDYFSDGVWNKEGADVCAYYMPVSADLIACLLKWAAYYDKLDNEAFDALHASQSLPKDFWKAFEEEGFHIAIEFKRQCPDWVVIYHAQGEIEELNQMSSELYPAQKAYAHLGYVITERWCANIKNRSSRRVLRLLTVVTCP